MTQKKKVLVSDPLGEEGLAILRECNDIEVLVETDLDHEALKKRLNEVDAVIVRSGTTLTADLLEGNTSLKVIGRAGIGVDNVDLPSATALGIVVMNTPHGNAVTTAEHTISLMMAAARRIPQAYAKLKGGKWDRKSFMGTELSDKTLGVIGLGNIGALVVERAIGLKMNVIGFDPFITEERAAQLGVELADVEEVIRRADVLTLHVPLTDKTRHLIDAKALASMKNDAILVNCARGGIVDETALNDALNSGEIAAAALDVFETEPPPEDHPLLQNERAVYTPHLGASTREAQTKVAIDVARQIVGFLQSGEVRNAVNAPSVSGELLATLGPYLRLGTMLGGLVAKLHDGPTDKICVKFGGDIGRQDTTPVVAKTIAAILRENLEEPINDVNALQIAKSRGVEMEATKSSQSDDYSSTIQVTLEGKDQTTTVTGAIFGKNDPRIVQINDFRMEPLAADGPLLFATNRDRPGVIGRVGTILGEHNINIAQMNVGRASKESGLALTVIALDDAADEATLEQLAGLEELVDVRQVVL